MEDLSWHAEIEMKQIGSDQSVYVSKIANIRRKIDQVDQSLSRLLANRMALVKQIKQVKSKLGLPIQDTIREKEVLTHISSSHGDREVALAIQAIYKSIFSQSRRLQSGNHGGFLT